MNRLGNSILALVAAFGFLLIGTEAKAQVSVTANLYGNGGSVQAYGTASAQYQFGHIDSMWMLLQGPDTNDEWQYEPPQGSTGAPAYVDHSMSMSLQPDSDYHLTVYACASDDNGGYCSSDQVHIRTAPGSGDPSMPSDVQCDESYGPPFPYVTSVNPGTLHLDIAGTYTYTLYGGNLENVIIGFSYIWAPNGSQFGGPGSAFVLDSSSSSHATFTYTNSGVWSEACFPCGGKLWLQDPVTYTPCYVPVTISP
jgi:hypothetical protein